MLYISSAVIDSKMIQKAKNKTRQSKTPMWNTKYITYIYAYIYTHLFTYIYICIPCKKEIRSLPHEKKRFATNACTAMAVPRCILHRRANTCVSHFFHIYNKVTEYDKCYNTNIAES